MSEHKTCPEGCGRPVEFSIHEGTGQRIVWNPGGIVIHTCHRQTKYWCHKCGDGGMAIPSIRPCVHRLQKENPQIKRDSLDLFS